MVGRTEESMVCSLCIECSFDAKTRCFGKFCTGALMLDVLTAHTEADGTASEHVVGDVGQTTGDHQKGGLFIVALKQADARPETQLLYVG